MRRVTSLICGLFFAALILFIGLNILLPQFLLGYLGMPHRLHADSSDMQQTAARGAASDASLREDDLKGFIAIEPIDIHTHILRSDPAFSSMLDRLHLHILNILVIDPKDDPAHPLFLTQQPDAWRFVSANAARVSFATNFNPFDWNGPGFPADAVASLNRDFSRGAIAATIWTNPGMQLRSSSGKFALPDDPRLQPIYQDIARQHKTFLAHLTGADEAWRPDGSTSGASPILAARDQIVRQNPDLRVIAAHLAGVKLSLAETAHLLDQSPNLAVDTSGRIDSLLDLPRDQVLAFFEKYQDRILYGSDMGFRDPDGTVDQVVAKWQSRYALEWRLLASDDTFEYKDHTVHCLHLPQPILRKLFHDNALHWLPGMVH